jgi:two-component system, NtrC family, response regulator AtoC
VSERPGSEHQTELVTPLASNTRRLAASVDGQLRFIDLPETGQLVIGRSSECDVILDHASVSRKHVVLHLSEDAVKVEDLGSANGTSLAGKRLTKGALEVFVPGVVLELGVVVVTLRDDRETGSAAETSDIADVVIADEAMREVHETVRIAAGSNLSVLLLGETGVGKELFARRIHELSPRKASALVRVNCAALVESLLEAELFGYERGAFTGATQAKPGLLEAASGGTLFLDEVGELPLSTQAKLLRVLESGEVTRVGALKPRVVDVRFVSATHRDVRGLVSSGRFREDLFFRLDGVSIRIPALRERTSEIVPLAKTFIDASARAANKPAPALSSAAIDRLMAHSWSGNVRELRNVIQRSVLFCRSTTLDADDLRFDTLGASNPPPARPRADLATDPSAPIEGLTPERAERRKRILEALESTMWNQTRAAEQLGISRRTLQTWMIDLRIPRPRTSR